MIVNDPEENYRTGYISLFRSIRHHWIFENDKYFKWWVIVLMEANHTERKMPLGYKLYEISKGQSANSLRTWSNLFNTGVKQVVKFFDLLEGDNMIKRKTIGKGKQSTTLVTIENYTQYQGKKETQETTQRTTQGKRNEPHEGGTNNNSNNYNNSNNSISKRKDEFKNELSTHYQNGLIDKIDAKEFFEYWTEHGKKDRKMRFEKEKSYNMERRISTWLKNKKNFEKEKSSAKKEKPTNVDNVMGPRKKEFYELYGIETNEESVSPNGVDYPNLTPEQMEAIGFEPRKKLN